MSRKAIWIVLGCYLAVALAGSALVTLTDPLPELIPAARIGETVGAALGALGAAGVIPLIVWACLRFRAASAPVPIVIWGFLGLVFFGASAFETVSERNEKLNTGLASIKSHSGKDYSDFLKNALFACREAQSKNDLNRSVGITADQINRYCGCYVQRMVDGLDPTDLITIAQRRTVSAAVQEKQTESAVVCGRQAIAR